MSKVYLRVKCFLSCVALFCFCVCVWIGFSLPVDLKSNFKKLGKKQFSQINIRVQLFINQHMVARIEVVILHKHAPMPFLSSLLRLSVSPTSVLYLAFFFILIFIVTLFIFLLLLPLVSLPLVVLFFHLLLRFISPISSPH